MDSAIDPTRRADQVNSPSTAADEGEGRGCAIAGVDAADLSSSVFGHECGDRLGERGGGLDERVGHGAEEAEHIGEADLASDGVRWSGHRDAGCGAGAGHPPGARRRRRGGATSRRPMEDGGRGGDASKEALEK
ncbi:unnamed protein product [Urochloa humidicola]